MAYLSKILPALVLPVSLVILLLLGSLVFRRRALALAALLALWVSSTPAFGILAIRTAEGWRTPVSIDSLPQARAIAVLGGMLTRPAGGGGTAEWLDAVDRFEGGVALLNAGKAPVVIFMGGWAPSQPNARREGEVLAERAVARGVPISRILVTGRVGNTAGEAAAVAQLLKEMPPSQAGRRVIVVTSAFHMRRAELLFRRAGLDVVAFPVDFQTTDSGLSALDFLPGATGLGRTETALRECYGYLFYLAFAR